MLICAHYLHREVTTCPALLSMDPIYTRHKSQGVCGGGGEKESESAQETEEADTERYVDIMRLYP